MGNTLSVTPCLNLQVSSAKPTHLSSLRQIYLGIHEISIKINSSTEFKEISQVNPIWNFRNLY
jgi:hypothetical protein